MEEENSEEIQEILEYPEDSAGRLMSPDVVAVRETSTVEEAMQHIRKTVTEERPFGVYAVDDHQHLIGACPCGASSSRIRGASSWASSRTRTS